MESKVFLVFMVAFTINQCCKLRSKPAIFVSAGFLCLHVVAVVNQKNVLFSHTFVVSVRFIFAFISLVRMSKLQYNFAEQTQNQTKAKNDGCLYKP